MKFPQEKIYLHSDISSYGTSEYIWFKDYLKDGPGADLQKKPCLGCYRKYDIGIFFQSVFCSLVFLLFEKDKSSTSTSNNITKLPMNILYAILLFALLCACSTSVPQNDASIKFDKEKYDFGKISYKREAICIFEFSNSNNSTLIIYEVKTSCGCTVPEWTKDPIHNGKKGELKIKYDADYPGTFHKTVEVFYNGPNSPAILEIKGEVEFPDDSVKEITN